MQNKESTGGKTAPALPALPPHKTRGLPTDLVNQLRALLGACQMFGSASGRDAPIEECQARMQLLKDHQILMLDALKRHLDARYEAGVEIGRSSMNL